jgi:hypothetical protein
MMGSDTSRPCLYVDMVNPCGQRCEYSKTIPVIPLEEMSVLSLYTLPSLDNSLQ